MRSNFISRFTPSLMDRDDLERMLLDRQGLVPRLVSLFSEGIASGTLPRVLLVGPRGSGKTHHLNVVAHRLESMPGADGALRIWLREEEWGIETFLDLMLRLLRRLAEEPGAEQLAARIEHLYALSPAQAELAAVDLLANEADGKPILLLLENMQDLFAGLKEKGQRKFRAWLQEQRVALLATTQALDDSVTKRNFPFFGFFDTYRLEGLSAEEARDLLVHLARMKGDEELATLLESETGLRRVKVINHLAGGGSCGNPRLYVVLSGVINHDRLDELVQAVLEMLDEMTPYYQARMNELPVQQRKLVEYLAYETDSPVPVKELAKRTFIAPNTASKQLEKLVARGFVARERLSRESFYELREPFMRLCFRVKKDRGRPVELIVEFLRMWYGRDEIEGKLSTLGPDDEVDRAYLAAALRRIDEVAWALLRDRRPDSLTPEQAKLVRDHIDEAHPHHLRQASMTLLGAEETQDAIDCLGRILVLDPSDALAHLVRGVAYLRQGNAGSAIQDARAVASRDIPRDLPCGENLELVAALKLGDHALAADALSRLLHDDDAARHAAMDWPDVVIGLAAAGMAPEARAAVSHTLSIASAGEEVLAACCVVASTLGDGPLWRRCRRKLGKLLGGSSEATSLATLLRELDSTQEASEHLLSMVAKVPRASLGALLVAVTAALPSEPDAYLRAQSHGVVRAILARDDTGSAGALFASAALAALAADGPSAPVAQGWATASTVLGIHPDLANAVRLIDAAVEYTRTGSRRPLLGLPREERALLEEALNIDPPNKTD